MIRGQLDDLGFPGETLREVQSALDDFGDGHGATRTFRFPELGVGVSLRLSTQPHIVSFARVHKLP